MRNVTLAEVVLIDGQRLLAFNDLFIGARTHVSARYRVEFYASAQNLTNRSNYSGFSGVRTSPYFLQATSVSNPRQVDISVRFNF